MTDVILGMGEVGQTLFDLLEDRKFDCVGIDLDNSKCKKYLKIMLLKIQNIFTYVYQEN